MMCAARPAVSPGESELAATWSPRLRKGAAVVLACAATLTAGGCTSIAGTRSAELATRPTPRPPTAAVLSGARLRELLLPASAMPPGFALQPASARDSGSQMASDTSTPPAPGHVCQLLTRSSWLLAAGVSGAAFAQNDYAAPRGTSEIGQEIDSFQGADAQEVMSRLWMVFRHCARFTARSGGRRGPVTSRATRLAGRGSQLLTLVLTSPLYRGGETLAAIGVRNSVVTCFASSPGRDQGAAAVTLAGRLAARVRAAAG